MEIFLDMDGTIADLYHVPGWLEEILAENPIPYITADPLPLVSELVRLRFNNLSVITWGSKGSTEEFLVKTEMAKIKWLEKNFLMVNKVHCVHYGTPKFLLRNPATSSLTMRKPTGKRGRITLAPPIRLKNSPKSSGVFNGPGARERK